MITNTSFQREILSRDDLKIEFSRNVAVWILDENSKCLMPSNHQRLDQQVIIIDLLTRRFPLLLPPFQIILI
jgi:hypothetical protein